MTMPCLRLDLSLNKGTLVLGFFRVLKVLRRNTRHINRIILLIERPRLNLDSKFNPTFNLKKSSSFQALRLL